MTREEYLNKRNGLLAEARQLITSGKIEEGNKKAEEVKQLDAEFDTAIKAQASLEALEKEPVGLNIQNLTDGKAENKTLEGNYRVTALSMDGTQPLNQGAAEMYATDVYERAWAKKLMNLPMSPEEQNTFSMVNEAYTHTTGNTPLVIPKTVTKGIWEEAGELYPYFGDITKTFVNGVLTMVKEDSSTDAAWYDEETATEDGKETFKDYSLDGCELSRVITVSWKLKEMAIEDFIPYIRRKMAKKMGAAFGYGATHGAGKVEGQKPEPTGVVTALKKEENTPQVVTYSGTQPTFQELTTARSKIKSGYSAGLAIYANSNTIWTKLANIMDANKRPVFVPDVTSGGTYRILGMPVKEDDSMKDGEILMSNAKEGYHMNINKEMTIMTEEHVKDRETDYCAYAIADGDTVTTKAHALLEPTAA